jgi:hypothetical protein
MAISKHGHSGLEPYRDNYYHDDPKSELFGKYSQGVRSISKSLSLVVAFVFSALFLQATLAANISLNGQKIVEFGQGTTGTPSCANGASISIKPINAFTNSNGSTGIHYLSGVTLSGIPNSCYGFDFTINAYGNAASTPLAIFNTSSTDAVVYDNAGTFQGGIGSSGTSITSGSGTFTLTFSTPVALATSIYKLTIQSSSHANTPCAQGGICVAGNSGPGGGTVFYVNAGGFTCGVTMASTCHYMEVAPTGWNGGTDPTRSWAQSSPIDYTSTNLILSQTLGYGAYNTRAIINQGNSDSTTSAAAMAASYSSNIAGTTYSDWFLPSENEAAEIYNQVSAIGFVASGSNYWTSSSVASANGRYFMFAGGTSPGFGSGMPKGTVTRMYVRPIRSF